MTRPTVLLESWFPFATVGAESLRERGAASALPPLYFLHVWWARRPLTISRAAIVASLLPDYESITEDPELKERFPEQASYHDWFIRLMGIYGDPVETRKQLRKARETGEYLGSDPYGYDRAFKTSPRADDLALLEKILTRAWGVDKLQDLSVLDPFAGGGSIPFEARRYGFATIANELNPVATVILKATLDYPARFGPELASEIKRWGRKWSKRVRQKLASYYPKAPGENIFAYLWARTVACPVTGKPVPLSPNWWLSKRPNVAVRLLTDPSWKEPCFEIVKGEAIDFDPNDGTVSRGVGRSPWTGDTIDSDYIKSEAQAGRMGETLYAIAFKRTGGFDFHSPTKEYLEALRSAKHELTRKRPLWEAEGVIPTEPFPDGNDPRPLKYGMPTWADMFSPRQLLSIGTYVETLHELRREIRDKMDEDRAAAIDTYLGMAVGKAVNYNSYLASWHVTRTIMRSVFDRHDFSFKWTFGEFDASANLLPWCIDQVYDAYSGIAKLVELPQSTLHGFFVEYGPLNIIQDNAADIEKLTSNSIDTIVTDPPYYDNVMYAELSDFFYVWLKRTTGHLYPEWFAAHLTDKDVEAVANPARFKGLARGRGRGAPKASDLAEQDYERKMAAAFREMHRVLRDDGVLTVMFTHKQVEAWDTLATALIGAGFSVESSWPVHTESRHSLHQAKKNAAKSTILLACRKRPSSDEPVWWDDVQGEVRREAREKATAFSEQGIEGVDLYLSTFGPALSVISRHWPVLTSEVDERTGEPKPLRPETALDLAREEVIRLRKKGLLQGREVQFDPTTDWYLMAWDAFRAERFPADEARKLALALGLDVESDLVSRRVLRKKGSDVILQQPVRRRGRGKVDPEATSFATWLDAMHTAMLVYAEDGAPACEAFLKATGFLNDGTFKACLQAMLNAIPRRKIKGKYVRKEAEVLERMRAAFFEDLEAPPQERAALREQIRMDL